MYVQPCRIKVIRFSSDEEAFLSCVVEADIQVDSGQNAAILLHDEHLDDDNVALVSNSTS